MFIFLPHTMQLDKKVLQPFLKNHQAHPFQTALPFSLHSYSCSAAGLYLQQPESQTLPLLPHTSAKQYQENCVVVTEISMTFPALMKQSKLRRDLLNHKLWETLVCSCQDFHVHKLYTKKHHCLALKLSLLHPLRCLILPLTQISSRYFMSHSADLSTAFALKQIFVNTQQSHICSRD